MRNRLWRTGLLLFFLLLLTAIGFWVSRKHAVFAHKMGDEQTKSAAYWKRITPLATRGAHFETLNPELPSSLTIWQARP